jgi:large subunit ribosomal protein L18
MSRINHYISKADKRKKRIRSKLFGTSERPRLTVFRANKYSYIQLVDDSAGSTVASSNDVKIRKGLKKTQELTKTDSAIKAAEDILAKMKSKKIKSVIFDRGQYKYHGRVKAIAETLRNNGIKV